MRNHKQECLAHGTNGGHTKRLAAEKVRYIFHEVVRSLLKNILPSICTELLQFLLVTFLAVQFVFKHSEEGLIPSAVLSPTNSCVKCLKSIGVLTRARKDTDIVSETSIG